MKAIPNMVMLCALILIISNLVVAEDGRYINKLTDYFPEDALAATIKNVDDYEDMAVGTRKVMSNYKGGMEEFEKSIKICTSSCRIPTKEETAKNIRNLGNAIKKNIAIKSFKDLPSEAQETVDAIKKGGPFPFKEDGTIFKNKEGKLPQEHEGYYKEYTVVKKGETGRGIRRMATGSNGEIYYTEDHYKTFEVIINGG